MIDFDALVLAPAQNILGAAIFVLPTLSQPLRSAYPARGIYEAVQQTVILEGGEEMSTTRRTLGIRLSEFPIPPRQGDSIIMGADTYLIDSSTPDGQGEAVLSLKATR